MYVYDILCTLFFFIIIYYLNSCKTKTGCKKPKALLLSSSQIHDLHTRLNILGKQSNRGFRGELAIQSCKLIETEIGKRDTNGEE